MNLAKKPRGTQDIYFEKSKIYQRIREITEKVLKSNNFSPVFFPSFEKREIFEESLGYSSDVVRKEMFNFEDRKGRKMVLRPEGTASIARMIVENRLLEERREIKFYYWANMFRYERPQKGRYREFWQLGIELVNVGSYLADLQSIKTCNDILIALGVKGFKIKINFLGGESIKNKFKEELRNNLKEVLGDLCDDCQKRYDLNPLRIMDCKKCQKKSDIICYKDFWDRENKFFVENLNKSMDDFSIPYEYDYTLVRGLDYYTGIVFEVFMKDDDKAIGGGGRYDKLYGRFFKKEKEIPATGFALGIDRLAEYLILNNKLSEKNNEILDIFFYFTNENVCKDNLKNIEYFRNCGLRIDFNLKFSKDQRNLIQRIDEKKFKLKIIIDEKSLVRISQREITFAISKHLLKDWIKDYFKLTKNAS